MRHILLTASAIACLALPALGIAQDRDNHGSHDNPAQHDDHHGGGGNDHGGGGGDHHGGGGNDHGGGGGDHHGGGGNDHGGGGGDHHGGGGSDHGGGGNDHHDGWRPGFDHGRPGFDPGRPGFDHGRGWSAGNRFWWRGRSEFSGYAGPRAGFWFVPGRGYINPGSRWLGYGWRVGGFVPPELRGYGVADPFVYGLGPAPYGFRYIYLGNNVALIRMGSGRIVSVMPEVY